MPPKREASQTVRLSFDEQEVLRRCAHDWDMDMSDLLRACIAIALPVMRVAVIQMITDEYGIK